MNKMIHAEMRLSNCSAELYINDIPIKKSDTPFISIPVHEYLVDGENTVALVIEPGRTPAQARIIGTEKDPEGMVATMRLAKYPVGEFTEDESAQVLVSRTWNGKSGEDKTFPKLLIEKIDLGKNFGRWAWQDAKKLKLNDTMIKKIIEVVKIVHNAYALGKGEPIVQLCHTFTEEVSRAYPSQSPDESDAEFINLLKEYRSNDDWVIEPLDSKQFDFRLCADTRLIEIIDKNWLPTVRSKPMKDGRPISFHMFLGIFDEKLQILR